MENGWSSELVSQSSLYWVLVGSCCWLGRWLHHLFVIWTTISLMENGLWTAVAIFATLLMLEHSDEDLPPLRTRLFFSILLVMVILSRPEGMLWAAVLGLGSFVGIWLRGGGLLRSFKATFLPALACLFTVGGLFTFRLYYFGYPFPNILCQGLPRSTLQSA